MSQTQHSKRLKSEVEIIPYSPCGDITETLQYSARIIVMKRLSLSIRKPLLMTISNLRATCQPF